MRSTRSVEIDAEDAPALPPGRFVDLAGRGTTFVRECGSRRGGPTLMLLHGLAASASLNWYTSFPMLEREHHVVALDHRGHGRGIRGRGAFTLEDAADDVVALADALDVEQFIPVGYSMGGPIAQLIWQRHPERVRGLVLCATSHTFRDSPQEHVMFASLPALEHVSRIVPDLLSAEIMSRVASRYLAESGHAGWVRRELRLRDQVAVLQAASALGRYSARRWIGNIDVPTAVLVHGRDQMVPPARQLALAAAIPHAATHVVDSDHFAPVRKGATFPRALLEAIDEVERQHEAHIGLRAAS